MPRMIRPARRYREWLVHFLAQCDECGWNTQDYEHGPRKAAEHARRTGHAVSGEKGYAVRYNEKGRQC
jgi:hypothetical protein